MAMEAFELNGFFTPSQKARFLRAIDARVSCRKFEAPPDTAGWAAAAYAASRCCPGGIRIVLGECTDGFFKPSLLAQNTITGVTRFAALVADTRKAEYRLLAGIALEAFVLSLTDASVASCIVGQSYKKKECPVMTAPYEEILCVVALGKAKKDVPFIPRKRKSLEKICRTTYLSSWPKWAVTAAKAVQAAPSHQNIQPWELSVSENSLFFHGQERQQMEIGIAMLHAECAIEMKHRWVLIQGERNLIAKVEVKENA